MTALLLPFCDGGPTDPDRSWGYRDSGDGAEDADDLAVDVDDGAVDDDRSFAAARGSVFVTPIFEGSC
jgi:hypothetical protein